MSLADVLVPYSRIVGLPPRRNGSHLCRHLIYALTYSKIVCPHSANHGHAPKSAIYGMAIGFSAPLIRGQPYLPNLNTFWHSEKTCAFRIRFPVFCDQQNENISKTDGARRDIRCRGTLKVTRKN